MTGRGRDGLFAFLLLGCLVVLWWPSLRFPYVQDDWGWMELFAFKRPASALAWAFKPEGRLLYRPLGALYHWVMYQGFGTDAYWPRVAAMLMSWLGALALVPVARALTGDRAIAWLAAVMFALATTARMDSILFQVGVKELGASMLGLAACALWFHGRRGFAIAAFAAALLTKETALSLVCWAALYEFLIARSPSDPWRKTLRRIVPILLLLAAYFLLRIRLRSPIDLPTGHLYTMTADPGRLGRHLWFYFQWSLFALFPWLAEHYEPPALLAFVNEHGRAIMLVALGLAGLLASLAIGLVLKPVRRETGEASPATLAVFLGCGAVLGILPVLPLAHIAFRYYLTFSLPALILLFLLVGRRVLAWPVGRRVATAILAAYVALFAFAQIRFFHARCAEGLDQDYWLGTCTLVKDATTVSIVQRDLLKLRPTLPPGSVLIFNHVDIWAFWQDSGPRVWYGDKSIDVYMWKYVRRDAKGWFVENPQAKLETIMAPTTGVRIDLDLARTFFFQLEKGALKEYAPDDARFEIRAVRAESRGMAMSHSRAE